MRCRSRCHRVLVANGHFALDGTPGLGVEIDEDNVQSAGRQMTASTEEQNGRTVGMTVLPEWAQVEGAETVLDNLQRRAGVNAIATSPYVMAPADAATGSREPPADAGAGEVRLLDRLLWGRREIYCRTAPSYSPQQDLYRGLRYQPAVPDDLTQSQGAAVGRFIAAAKARGMQVYLQVQAAIPPGYRVQFGSITADDQPLLPDGASAQGRVDKNGSLASPHVRAYLKALLADLGRAYPQIDGFRIDWPEYPPYTLDSAFLDFSDHAVRFAMQAGYDVDRMRRDALAARKYLLGGLGEADLDPHRLKERLQLPGLQDLFALKSDIVEDFLKDIRSGLPQSFALVPQAFPAPWNRVSGFDYARAARHSDGIGVKLYTMHWPMMLRFYGDSIMAANKGLDAGKLARLLVALCETGGPPPTRLDDLRYPEPGEAHPVGHDQMAQKIRNAQAAAGDCPVYAFAHGYGPVADVASRLRTAWEAGAHGIWINRYGYMSDEKLDAVGVITGR
jgi:hypothetical protein